PAVAVTAAAAITSFVVHRQEICTENTEPPQTSDEATDIRRSNRPPTERMASDEATEGKAGTR
ncbi:hypothetical protein, partial [Streptomyces microflavus]